MLDWFESGLIGGLFGKNIAQFLRRFRLRIIFCTAAVSTELFFSYP